MTEELQAQIRKTVADENVKHIQLWFTDILGNLKMVEIPDRQLDSVLESGAPFDGSSITGYAEIEESDIVAMPDWTTFKILPWSQNQEKTAFAFQKLAEKTAGAAGRADERTATQVARLAEEILPQGTLAERVYSALPYALRFGRGPLVGALRRELKWNEAGLQVIEL